jgi:hypothetical protein
MPDSKSLDMLIPHKAPDSRIAHTLLFAIRCMAVGGLNDAHAANAMLARLGMGYRRPLMFLRILMREISRVSQRPIAIAPCCCRRMTDGEAAFLLMIESGRANPEAARANLARVTRSLDTMAALSVAHALADALDDAGRPFSL